MQQNDSYSLYVREWVIVYVFLTLLLILSVRACTKKQALIAPETTICVTVVGSVLNEMTLQIHPLSTVADLLSRISLSEEADCDKLLIDERVKPGVFVVPCKNKTTIYVTGEVEKSGAYAIREGCRFNELPQYIALTDSADKRFFSRKRRLVQEGELVVVPKNKRK